MARVPRAADIGVSSFNVGNAAQIDIGVAKEIGRAGNAIGDAVAALGGAFGELAGRVSATEQAGNYSGLVNDLYDADAKIESSAYENAQPDGSQWQGAGTQLGEFSLKWKEDPRWGSLTPKQRASAENAHRDLMRRRALGTDSYPNRYRKGQFEYQSSKLGETANSSMARLSLEDERNQGVAPQVYDERVEAEKSLVMGRIDEMTGTVFTPAQAAQLKEQYSSQFAQRKLENVLRDPEAAKEFFKEYNSLKRDAPKEGQGPSYLGGPGSKSDVGKGPTLTEGQVSRLKGVRPELTEKLGALQQSFGKELPINSGFRDRGHNAKVGGAKGSQHIHGNAVDISVKDLSKEERIELIRQASAQGFTGIGVYNNAIHLDMGERRSWGPSHSTSSVPAWAKGVIGEHLSGKAQPTQVASADGQPQQTSQGVDFRGQSGPASIRFNNPGAMYPGPSSKKYGAVETKIIGGGHKIAVFPDAVSGAAAQFDLLSEKYTGKTLQSAIKTWSGGNSVATYLKVIERETGLKADTVLTKEMIADPKVGIAIAKAMAVQEAGKPYPLSDEQWKEAHSKFSGGGSTEIVNQQEGGSRPPGMMTLGAGDVEAASAVASEAGIDVSRFAQLPPETKLSEAGLTEEELTALEARAPEGVNVREVTVAEAGELVGQATGQPATMNDAGPQQQAQAEEAPTGEVIPGQEMIVRYGNGFSKFGPDELKYFTPKVIKTLEKDFRAKQAIAQKRNQGLADEMMKAQLNSLDIEGKELDQKFYNSRVVDAAYPPGSPKRLAYERKVESKKIIAGIFNEAGNKSYDDLEYEVAKLQPKGGLPAEDYNIQAEAFKTATAKLDAVTKMRDEDPAQAVESHSLVKDVRSKFDGGVPKTPSQKQALIEARIFAQREIGIPERKRSPITAGEAKRYVSALRNVPEEELDAALEEVAKSVKENYGQSYSGVVLKSIIQNYAKLGAEKEAAMGVIQAMASTINHKATLGPLEIQKARESAELRARQGIFRVPEQLKFIGNPVNAFEKRVEEAEWGVKDTLLWAGDKILSGGRALNKDLDEKGLLPESLRTPKKPSKEDLERAKSDMSFKNEFARKYNLTPVEALNYIQGNK